MILFFGDSKSKVFAVETSVKLSAENLEKIYLANDRLDEAIHKIYKY